jgi:hypothetical protein
VIIAANVECYIIQNTAVIYFNGIAISIDIKNHGGQYCGCAVYPVVFAVNHPPYAIQPFSIIDSSHQRPDEWMTLINFVVKLFQVLLHFIPRLFPLGIFIFKNQLPDLLSTFNFQPSTS